VATSRIPRAWLLLLPALLAIAVHLNTLPNELAADDPMALQRAQGMGEAGLSRFLLQRRGLFDLTLYADSLVWGAWIPGYRLTNLFLHGLATFLAACVALRISGSALVAALTGALFAVHPVHVEAVASLENRKDLLALVVVGAAVLAYLSRSRPRSGYWAAWILFAVGVIWVKDIAVAGLALLFPLLDLLLPSGPPERRWRRAAVHAAPFLSVLALVVLTFFPAFVELFSARAIYTRTDHACRSYAEVFATSGAAAVDGFRLLFFPASLSVDYPPQIGLRPSDPKTVFGVALVTAWCAVALRLARTRGAASLAMLWTVVMFLPCSNLVPIGKFFLAERYYYVPSFGVCLLVALGLAGLCARPRPWDSIAVLAALLLLASATWRTLARNADWRSEEGLLATDVRTSGPTARLHRRMAATLGARGRWAEAAAELEKARALAPDAFMTLSHLGNALRRSGQLERAIEVLEESRSLNPGYPANYLELGLCYELAGRHAEALDVLERGLELVRDPQMLKTAAVILSDCPDASFRDYPRAVALAAEAVERTGSKDRSTLVALALAQLRTGDVEDAFETAERASQLAAGADPAVGGTQKILDGLLELRNRALPPAAGRR
jgi:tetratricopeptide (TPR) repeat protein